MHAQKKRNSPGNLTGTFPEPGWNMLELCWNLVGTLLELCSNCVETVLNPPGTMNLAQASKVARSRGEVPSLDQDAKDVRVPEFKVSGLQGSRIPGFIAPGFFPSSQVMVVRFYQNVIPSFSSF